jgi:hypothetical protein
MPGAQPCMPSAMIVPGLNVLPLPTIDKKCSVFVLVVEGSQLLASLLPRQAL